MDPHDRSTSRELALFGFFLAATADLRTAEALTREAEAVASPDPWEAARSRIRQAAHGGVPGRSRLSPSALDRLAGELAGAAEELSRRAPFLRESLEDLAGPPREMVALRYREGFTIPVLAERLGRSVPAVEMALARARLRLREAASRRSGAPAEAQGPHGEVELLIERYLGGTAATEEVRRLEDLLERDPAGRRAFLLALGEDAVLRNLAATASLLTEGTDAPRPPSPRKGDSPRRASPKFRTFATAGILLSLAAFLIWLFPATRRKSGTAAPPPPPSQKAPKPASQPAAPPSAPATTSPDSLPLPPNEPAAPPALEKTFHFNASPWPPLVRFEASGPAGPVVGWARTVSGSATLDLETGTGRIHLSVPVEALGTGATFLDGALKAMFEAAGARQIEFISESVMGPGRGRPSASSWEVEGLLTAGDRKAPLRLREVGITPVDEETALRGGLGPGEWIRVRSEFPLRPADWGLGMDSFRGLLDAEAAWTVHVDLLAGTVRPPEGERFERLPGLAATGAPPPIPPPEGPGKLYRLGRHPSFTLLRAEGTAGTERTEVFSRSLWGWIRADFENGRARAILQIPPRSVWSAAGDLRRWLHGDLPASPLIRFESTEAVLRDESSASVRGNLEIFGKTVALYLVVGMNRLEAGSCPSAGLDREGWILSASFRTGLSELLPSLVRWDRAALPWEVRIGLLAELEE